MKILLTGAFSYTEKQINYLKQLGCEIFFIKNEREKIDIDVSEIEGIICNGFFLFNDIKKFKKLKFIQLTSAGLDRVPINYIKEKNIKIFNAKGVYSIPIAEWVVLKTLESYKKSKIFYNNQEEKIWKKERELKELTDKKIGIVGFGSIGQEIAKRLKCFGTFTIAIDVKKIDSKYIDSFWEFDKIEEILAKLDVVILTLPLTKDTKYLFDKRLLDKFKEDSLLINVSRGAIIKEKDLIAKLKKNKNFQAILDVYEEEPLNNENKLWNLENVILTPHNSFVSEKTNERMFELITKNIEKVMKGI